MATYRKHLKNLWEIVNWNLRRSFVSLNVTFGVVTFTTFEEIYKNSLNQRFSEIGLRSSI